MAVVDEREANMKTFKLRSGGATLRLSASNLFYMTPKDRDFVMSILGQLELYSESAGEGEIDDEPSSE